MPCHSIPPLSTLSRAPSPLIALHTYFPVPPFGPLASQEAVRKLDFWTARRRHRSTASERAAVQDMVQMNPVYTIAGPVTAGKWPL